MKNQKIIYLDGMGNPRTYPLNACEVIFTLPLSKGEVKCQILWGEPLGCEGCPRDKHLEFLFGEDNPPQRGRK